MLCIQSTVPYTGVGPSRTVCLADARRPRHQLSLSLQNRDNYNDLYRSTGGKSVGSTAVRSVTSVDSHSSYYDALSKPSVSVYRSTNERVELFNPNPVVVPRPTCRLESQDVSGYTAQVRPSWWMGHAVRLIRVALRPVAPASLLGVSQSAH